MTRKSRIAKWLVFLSGPLIWFAHFGFIYAAATLDITLGGGVGPASRIAVGVATLIALGLIAILWTGVHRRRFPRWDERDSDLARFWNRTSLLLLALSFVATLWDGLPALFF